jgi:hypothetical protein
MLVTTQDVSEDKTFSYFYNVAFWLVNSLFNDFVSRVDVI